MGLIDTVEFVRLIDWHLRILVAVRKIERGIVGIDVKDGTGESGDCRNVVGLSSDE